MRKYTIEQLSKLQYEPLYRHFKDVRASVTSCFIYCDGVKVDPLYEAEEIEKMEIYLQLVVQELHKRPYQKVNKETKAKQKKQNLAGLKGNRFRPRNKSRRRKAP